MRVPSISSRVPAVALRSLGVLSLCVLCAPGLAQEDDRIDFDKARQLRQRRLQGERLSDEERNYLERAKAAFQKRQGRPGAGPGRLVSRDSTGLTPLTDLAGEARYKGRDGGLYGGGKNEPPAEHLRAALKVARQVRPLDAQGRPSPDGKVVLISVGMSNTTQEFRRFMALADGDPERSPAVVLVDGAQGGMEASAWAHPERATRAGRPDPWAVLDQRLRQAGVTARQVQVAWIKQARANPAALGEFPRHAQALGEDLAVIVRTLQERYPHLKIAYLSSRIYAGYASTPLNPEPYAYESAFAVQGLIRDQVAGRPALNHDPDKGQVAAPVLLWGPYLWADGVKGRKAADLVWTREDLAGDGTHPGASGQQKVADRLLRFLKTDPTSRGWFLRAPEADRTKGRPPSPDRP